MQKVLPKPITINPECFDTSTIEALITALTSTPYKEESYDSSERQRLVKKLRDEQARTTFHEVVTEKQLEEKKKELRDRKANASEWSEVSDMQRKMSPTDF